MTLIPTLGGVKLMCLTVNPHKCRIMNFIRTPKIIWIVEYGFAILYAFLITGSLLQIN